MTIPIFYGQPRLGCGGGTLNQVHLGLRHHISLEYTTEHREQALHSTEQNRPTEWAVLCLNLVISSHVVCSALLSRTAGSRPVGLHPATAVLPISAQCGSSEVAVQVPVVAGPLRVGEAALDVALAVSWGSSSFRQAGI